MALLNAGEAAPAARVLDWSAVARPSAAPIHLSLVNARRDAGDLEGARRAFDSAIRLAPSDPDA
jgi:Flp pilus assembly protein TadD